MQNSALAVLLAQRGLGDPLSAIPGAVSATCHSLIGSAVAAYWRTTDRKREATAAAPADVGTKSDGGGASMGTRSGEVGGSAVTGVMGEGI